MGYIINELKAAKYVSVSIDTTPGASIVSPILVESFLGWRHISCILQPQHRPFTESGCDYAVDSVPMALGHVLCIQNVCTF